MSSITRRAAVSALAAAAVGAPFVLRGRYRVFAQSPTDYSARAVRLMEETPVVEETTAVEEAPVEEAPVEEPVAEAEAAPTEEAAPEEHKKRLSLRRKKDES